MAVEADMKNLAKDASDRYARILDGLEEYYRSDMTFGLLAEKLRVPARALIEFMRRYKLPYKGGEGDRERGLAALANMRRP
jgi:hypothetical protein